MHDSCKGRGYDFYNIICINNNSLGLKSTSWIIFQDLLIKRPRFRCINGWRQTYQIKNKYNEGLRHGKIDIPSQFVQMLGTRRKPLLKITKMPTAVVYTHNPRIWEAEMGKLQRVTQASLEPLPWVNSTSWMQ